VGSKTMETRLQSGKIRHWRLRTYHNHPWETGGGSHGGKHLSGGLADSSSTCLHWIVMDVACRWDAPVLGLVDLSWIAFGITVRAQLEEAAAGQVLAALASWRIGTLAIRLGTMAVAAHGVLPPTDRMFIRIRVAISVEPLPPAAIWPIRGYEAPTAGGQEAGLQSGYARKGHRRIADTYTSQPRSRAPRGRQGAV